MNPICPKCDHEMDILYVTGKQTITICSNCNYDILAALASGAEVRMEIVESFLVDDKHREWRVIEEAQT